MEIDLVRFGANLRRLRTAKGWSIREMAERSGVAKNTVLHVEQGKPSTRTAREALARAVGTFAELVLVIEPNDQTPFELVSAEASRWRVSFFSPDRNLPSDINDLIQDPKERERLARLGWISRYERSTVPRRSAKSPGMRLMEIWAANGRMAIHNDVELVTVTRGAIRLILGDERIELQEGQGASFLATIPHDYEPLNPVKPGSPPPLALYVLIPLES